ncbi:MAG: transporter [Deltaproteobacteria bacterium]|nr:MAG: transporter [Deltaproteobacteria bacterium]
MKNLILGSNINYIIALLAFVIAMGFFLGKYKIKGISIGSTWILFVGIILSHFGLTIDSNILVFIKDFGLILFVFAIGLQVGPGFFHSFKQGGLTMNLLALGNVLLAAIITYIIHLVTGERLQTMVGVMSGAVTNTPGLGAAQQTLSDTLAAQGGALPSAASHLASAYAVAYPVGVIGVLFLVIFFKFLFAIDLDQEKRELEGEESGRESAKRIFCEVTNPSIQGKTLQEIRSEVEEKFVVSRIMRNGEISCAGPDTVFNQGDKLLIVISPSHAKAIKQLFGVEVFLHIQDWQKDERYVTKRLTITKASMTGKRLRDLHIRSVYDVIVTRILRAGVQLVARPDCVLQMGDSIQVVGTEAHINSVAQLVGNTPESLTRPNLMPIFFGIAVGVIVGSIPLPFPGVPQPIKLGLAGGPLIIAILLAYFGPKCTITTYTTISANMMVREIGISFFLAAVGLGAGENFIYSIIHGGYWWILYGACITLIPPFLIGLVARYICKLNFYQICGLISGSNTNPPVLAFAQNAYGTDFTSVNYATVYPLSMFMRVLVAQLFILLAFI